MKKEIKNEEKIVVKGEKRLIRELRKTGGRRAEVGSRKISAEIYP